MNRGLTWSLAVFITAWTRLFGQQADRAALPIAPIEAVVNAFESHSIVAIGEPHGNEQFHAFRMALLRNPRFQSTVDDILVESGNARYQATIDRFIRGENVPYELLRKAWQDTTVPEPLWDLPIYEEFFRAVRAVNEQHPEGRPIRVLLGDPPIDWSLVHTFRELDKWFAERDRHPARVIRDEVLARHRRALVIYGDGHLWRNIPRPTITSLLESTNSTTTFVVATPTDADWHRLQPDAYRWHAPGLLFVRGTALGSFGFAAFYRRPGPGNPWRNLTVADEADAVLFLGPASTMTSSRLTPTLCSDPAYRAMRLERMSLDGSPMEAVVRRFHQYCNDK